MLLPFQGSFSPPYIRQQVECSLYEYKLDDKTLQKAQLKQHKMFQNFPTLPALAVPSAPSPLVVDMKPKVPSIRGQNKSDDDSSDALFDTKANNTFSDDNDKPLTYIHVYKNRQSTHSPSRQRRRIYWLYNLESLRPMIFCLPCVKKG